MRVLFVAANFAPRGASPAIRTVNLCRALHDAGHELRVVTYDEETLTAFSPNDSGLAAKVPAEVRVARVSAGPLRRRTIRRRATRDRSEMGARKRRLLRNPLIHVLVPDPHVESVRRFLKAARSLTVDWQPEVIVSFAYPFSMHIVGERLASDFSRAHWIADYGDPWSGPGVEELGRPPWRRRLDTWIERRLLSKASKVTLTTTAAAAAYRRIHPSVAERVDVVPMGFDPEDFAGLPPVEFADAHPRIVHAGRLYREARDPSPFLDAVRSLWDSDARDRMRWRISFVGEVAPDVVEEIESHPSRAWFEFIGWVSYHESLAWMKSATCQLIFGNHGGTQIPGKLFNAIGAGRPILLTSEGEPDPAAAVLRESRAGVVVANDREALRTILARGPEGLPSPPGQVAEQYTWRRIAERMLAGMHGEQGRDRE